ncbi:hypothetical protein AYI69_g7255 [Smittium culicis]|uniref:DUF4246 domain-containing protein n=1 Tax=Smittium culicis TaxID=133412 RepID=A0A1R1XT96_9FUNG|nr:hypothetical protein AYI69_g11003 [Smittium culicis]OMJ17887.1 hypothetical protein AYI69_g7255 [Smittium culicis]
MANDHIVSVAVYYYDQENLTDSKVYFRTNARGPRCEQYDCRTLTDIYGFYDQVDPSKQIISTATVHPPPPSTKKSWFDLELRKSENRVSKQPYEISDLISDELE